MAIGANSSFLDQGATNAGNAAISELLNNSPLHREFEDFKRGYGTGFKKNLFLVSFFFGEKFATGKAIQKLKTNLRKALNKPAARRFSDKFAESDPFLDTTFQLPGGSDMVPSSSQLFVWKGMVNSVRLPGHSLNDINPYGNFTVPISLGRQDLSMTFLNDQYNVNYMFWRNLATQITDTKTSSYFDDYSCSIAIELLTTQQKTHQLFLFTNCYPKNVPDLELTADSADKSTVDITFGWEGYQVIAGSLGVDLPGLPDILGNIDANEQLFILGVTGLNVVQNLRNLLPIDLVRDAIIGDATVAGQAGKLVAALDASPNVVGRQIQAARGNTGSKGKTPKISDDRDATLAGLNPQVGYKTKVQEDNTEVDTILISAGGRVNGRPNGQNPG